MSLRYSTGPRSGCDDPPSDLALDGLHLGTLEAARRSAVRGHLDGCPDCAARFARVAEGFDAFPGFDPRPALAAARPAERASRWWLMGLAGLAAAAAVALVVLQPAAVEPPDGPPGVRSKGSAALRVYRQSTGSDAPAEEALSGSLFEAGDHVRFAVDLPAAGAVAIYGREGLGEPYLAWPRDGADPTLPAGDGQLLEGGSSRLDAAPGPENLYLVHCPSAERVAPCAAEGEALRCAAGCTVSRFVIRKSAPAGGR